MNVMIPDTVLECHRHL